MESDSETVVPASVKSPLCDHSDITFVVAFGSRVADRSRPASDLDIAIKFADSLSSTDRFREQCRLSGQLQTEGTPFIDLSDIEELSLEFAHAAVSGEFVCGDRKAFEQFKKEIEHEFSENKREREKEHREQIRRIADEGLHG